MIAYIRLMTACRFILFDLVFGRGVQIEEEEEDVRPPASNIFCSQEVLRITISSF